MKQALSLARVMVSWLSIGVAMGVYDLCNRYIEILLNSHLVDQTKFVIELNRYVNERKQFGVPLAAFQLTQEKLVRMLGNIQAMFLTGWRLCKLHESGKMTAGHASMGKVCASIVHYTQILWINFHLI